MAVRQKQTVLDIAYGHFKEHKLPLTIEYKDYVAKVGADKALHAVSVKRSFKAWKYVIHALKLKYPELMEAPKPAPKAKPAPSKPAKAEKKSED